MRRILSILLAVVMVFAMLPSFALSASAAEVTASKPAVGDGSAENPYQITTAGELKWFCQSASKSACAKLMANVIYNENVIVDGTVNEDTSGFVAWTPMGNRSYPYTGTFDGNGHYISGLYCTSTYTSNYRGLFGCVDGATIKNLTIKDSCFYATNDQYMGAFVGGTKDQGSGVTIDNCHNVNSIVCCPGYAGGILGYNQRASVTITDCSNSGDVSGWRNLGGLACYNSGTISDSCNTGKITATSDSTSTPAYSGGLLAYVGSDYKGGTIENSYNTGKVSGNVGVGGIVKGVSENEFAPNVNITREQFAAIMFRYAEYKGMSAVTLEENLHFDDADDISEYAISAMSWAVGSELIKGRSEKTLCPKDTATRAECAAIFHRFFETNK